MSQAPNAPRPTPRHSATLSAFLIGVPLAVGALALIEFGPLGALGLKRYVEHPVEIVEIVLFCCALGALTGKVLGYCKERLACRLELVSAWDGTQVSADQAIQIRAELHQNAGLMRESWLARRLDAVLDFVGKRKNAEGLDDQLRSLADNDALALDNSYSLIRFITWAIPILGFLGTVLGITQAIAGVTPEALERSLSTVTEGLALAFDTTAVGLALTMVTMFLSFLAERMEQSVLEYVDHFADVQLAHRFERTPSGDQGQMSHELKQNMQALVGATEQLVQQQANIWVKALSIAQEQWAMAAQKEHQKLSTTLEKALEKTLTAHQGRLVALEQHVEKQGGALVSHMAALAEAIRQTSREHHDSLVRVVEAVTAQTDALARLQDDGKQLIKLQDVLHHNLAAIQGAGSFDQAVQSLTAAIHLLTAKTTPGATGTANRFGARPGAAA